jgi:hypothetical protein
MDKLGLGYEECRSIRPDVVYCTVSAFGQRGPYADRPASDTGMQGLSGMMHGIGEPCGEPLRVSFPLIDVHAGNLAVQGVRVSIRDPYLVHEVNATATLHLLTAALDEHVNRFVYCSSSEVYGTARHSPMTEEHPLVPVSDYNKFKGLSEPLLLKYQSPAFTTVIIRPSNSITPRLWW